MSRKINTLIAFYIDHNLDQSDESLARTCGVTTRQVKARRSKLQGKNREGNLKSEPETKALEPANTERQAELENQAQKAAEVTKTADQPRPEPGMRIDALFARKHGVTSMTQPASELADMFDGVSNTGEKIEPVVKSYDPFSDKSRVHRIK